MHHESGDIPQNVQGKTDSKLSESFGSFTLNPDVSLCTKTPNSSLQNTAAPQRAANEISHIISSSGLSGQGRAERHRTSRKKRAAPPSWRCSLPGGSVAVQVEPPLRAFTPAAESNGLTRHWRSVAVTWHHGGGGPCHAPPTKP